MAISPTYPGVYVEEVSSGIRPIQAASTSTAAFIGQANKGKISEAVKIYNFTQFQTQYGDYRTDSYLAHAAYQFFNNGGSQLYIVRVAENAETADITLVDQHATTPLDSLVITAISPGEWGNGIEIEIRDGTLDSDNEFDMYVYEEGATEAIETFKNLSMVETAPNFVENVTAASSYITVSINDSNGNVTNGRSVGSAAAAVSLPSGETKFKINIDGDGFQEVDLQSAVDDTTVADLNSLANIIAAIMHVVSNLMPQRASTLPVAFSGFSCAEVALDPGVLELESGSTGFGSSVQVAMPDNRQEDASGLLELGIHNEGSEILGGAVTRPALSTSDRFLVGDHNAVADARVSSVTEGTDGTAITTDTPYINALSALDNIKDVSLIAVPGIGSADMIGAGMNYCENRSLSDCFYIGDALSVIDTVPEVQSLAALVSPNNSYGALYVPWVTMLDPTGISPEPIKVPPSGFVAGMYAKTDAKRGVWKAPAGTGASLAGTSGLAYEFSDVEQGNLNPINVNVIRQFAGVGRTIWGARTLTSDPEWKYVPVRRMAIFLRVSIYYGIQWAVFEPNDEPLWAQLRTNLTSFMMTLFRQGAFQGSKASDAFFVKCDSETTTQDDINNGVVNVLVGFAPLKPAEFVIVKISQKAGQSS